MSRYQMIAFDMDGTLLNSKKEITAPVQKAIEKAAGAGKTVILSTGRSLSELRFYGDALSHVRYWVIESGAMVWDSWKEKILYRKCFDDRTQKAIASVYGFEDVAMLGMSEGESYFGRRILPLLDHYNVEIYRSLYEKIGTKLSDEKAFFESNDKGFEKINIFCTSEAARERIHKELLKEDLPVTYADSEISNLECSPEGISKASGIREVCRDLQISMDDVIAVGDADNDLEMLKAVGLPIAMGNANQNVKAEAGAVVADNDHDGTAEAVYQYLLQQ